MGVVYAMYDALVSINVPDEKAKAVIDALEREMMDKLATKADVAHLKEVISTDIRAFQQSLFQDMRGIQESLSQNMRGIQESLSHDIRGLEGATKVDAAHIRELHAKDMEAVNASLEATQKSLSQEISAAQGRTTSALETGLARMESRLTIRLGGLTVGCFTVAAAVVGAIQLFR